MWPIALSISQLWALLFVHINNCTHGKQQPSFQILLLGKADGVIVTLKMYLVGSERVSDPRRRLSDQSSQMCTETNGVRSQRAWRTPARNRASLWVRKPISEVGWAFHMWWSWASHYPSFSSSDSAHTVKMIIKPNSQHYCRTDQAIQKNLQSIFV